MELLVAKSHLEKEFLELALNFKSCQEIINLNKVQNPKSKSVLFLDAVKLYFNQL